jgi:hypothetical protein
MNCRKIEPAFLMILVCVFSYTFSGCATQPDVSRQRINRESEDGLRFERGIFAPKPFAMREYRPWGISVYAETVKSFCGKGNGLFWGAWHAFSQYKKVLLLVG